MQPKDDDGASRLRRWVEEEPMIAGSVLVAIGMAIGFALAVLFL